MAKKNENRSTEVKKPKRKKSQNSSKELVIRVEFRLNELIIKFDKPPEILSRLLESLQNVNEPAFKLFSQPATATEDVLGSAKAREIVSGCAGSSAWGMTIGELVLNPLIFRNCVASGVDDAGYIPPEDIPATSDTRLIDVVYAIQGAAHK